MPKYLKLPLVALSFYAIGYYIVKNDVGATTSISMSNPVDTAWSDATRKKIKAAFMQREDLKIMKVKARSYFCDCYIQQLVLLYPKGISKQVPENVVNRIAIKCVDQMSSHAKELE